MLLLFAAKFRYEKGFIHSSIFVVIHLVGVFVTPCP